MAKKKLKQQTSNGFSLVELLVVLVIVASLVALSIPAINAMQKSFGSTGAEGMISAALSTARTLAIKNGHYAGVRFQKAYDVKGPLEANQYMIFIINDEDMGTLTDAFRAIEGYKPIKLPENTGAMDMSKITKDSDIVDACVVDATAFSIIFSSAGKLVIHDVQTRNKDGKYRPSGLTGVNGSDDKVFNSVPNITVNNTGQFVQDDYPIDGLDKEQSRNKFVIYDCEKFSRLDVNNRYSKYLKYLKFIYINAYTGEIIK
ncbi:MAG: prepilin-type N-terminal cleavage/methylation domain-containing protein [Phycisphaerae bacterium]|nr:prepilin-type N-terminal cleavage/methylation domain-containing protein [Phycisphaerae bacterium]